MKITTLMIAVLLLALVRPVQADFVTNFNTGFQNGGVIPDGSLTGWSDTRSLNALPSGPISGVSVTLNLSGGWNGDLYAYLVHDNGFAVLLNRAGRSAVNGPGYGNAGMNVVLSDGGSGGDFHWYGGLGVPTGPYVPDGRNIDPLSAGAIFSSTTPSALLSSFNGLNANGNWTLFIADVSETDQSTVANWGLDIAAVPEPGSLAMLFLGGLIGLYRLKRAKVHPQPC